MTEPVKISVLVSLYRCNAFLRHYMEYATRVQGLDVTEFLFLHNDPLGEEIAVMEEFLPLFPNATYVKIPQREGLYESWNRGIRLAKGEYITIWNVDDIRNEDSLLLQKNTLDVNPRAMICYGDFYETIEYGKNDGFLWVHPKWKKDEPRRYEVVGCFPMWRKKVHEVAGFFDENFKLVADYEFLVRVTLNGFPLVKANGILGYYLGQLPHKLSSQRDLQHLEKTAVQLRYGIYDKMNMYWIRKAKRNYKIRQVISFHEARDVAELITSYKAPAAADMYFSSAPFFSVVQIMKRTAKKIIRRK